MELQENYGKFRGLNAEVLAISVDDALDAGRIVERYGFEYPVLYDPTQEVARAWEIFDLLNDGVAAPAAYVFDSSGELFAYKIGEDIADRPTAAELIATVAAAEGKSVASLGGSSGLQVSNDNGSACGGENVSGENLDCSK